ncbi:unnamed protein product [Adineta steineri]|uniref:N-alpha-acetyltransferase 60 n=1 Tax=Adineta steineri TaxID=433720 RepID=A0A815IRF5_9BILA|nr:unnamed protein product [Adineta steineri]CAF1604337.1 unnamed protein product [Adineta steineri]
MQTSSSSSSILLNLDIFDTESIHVLPNSNLSITFRFLRPGDQSEVKILCRDWFPIEYPDKWYDDIVYDKKYFALAVCDVCTQQIIGLIVANILPIENCNREDQQILNRIFSLTASACYILILGVVKEYRRQGLANLLLENLLNTLYRHETCKAVYLHVLHSNKQAIQFYQSNLFQYRTHLPYYYLIKGEHLDAYCFVRYLNGGYPPFTLTDFATNAWSYLTQIKPCRLLNTIRYFLTDKFLFTDYYKRTSTYRQISRIV